MTSIIKPTYRTGFYSPIRGGVPRYPNLWRSCVHFVLPALGETGKIAFEQRNKGRINNRSVAAWTNINDTTTWNINGVWQQGWKTESTATPECDMDGTTPYSAAVMARFTASGYQIPFCRQASGGTGGFAMWCYAGPFAVFLVSASSSTNAIGVQSSAVVGDSKLSVFGFSYDGSRTAAGVTLYRDGVVMAKGTNIYDTLTLTTSVATIIGYGTRHDTYTHSGQIAGAAIWQRALVASEWKDIGNDLSRMCLLDHDSIGKAGVAPATRNDNLLLLGVS